MTPNPKNPLTHPKTPNLPSCNDQIPPTSPLDKLKPPCIKYRMTNNRPHIPNPSQRHIHIPHPPHRAQTPFTAPAGKPADSPMLQNTALITRHAHPKMLTTNNNPHNTPGEGNNALLRTNSSRKHRPSLAPFGHQNHGGWSMTHNHPSVPITHTHREEK